MRLRFTPEAQADLREITTRYSNVDPRLARRIIGSIKTKCHRLLRFPYSAPPLDPQHYGDLRRLVVEPYLVVYRVRGEVVEVLRVVYGSRDLDPILAIPPSGTDE
jgi:toxin ParE1/3/4